MFGTTDITEAIANPGSLFWTIILLSFTSPLILYAVQRFIFFLERKLKYPGWVAVFLTNDHVYFGALKKLTKDDLKIENIYYLRSDIDSNSEDGLGLVKLGEELHGPEDFMLINRSQVLFIESLREDGQVVKAIQEYLRTKH